MKLGVVSDTHNRISHIETICQLFIQSDVDAVVHTGDVASPKALEAFGELNVPVYGAWGNNDLPLPDLVATSNRLGYHFHEGWKMIELDGYQIYLGHDPQDIDSAVVALMQHQLVLHGHTHRYTHAIDVAGNLTYNPGECAGIMKGKNAVGIVDMTNLTTQRLFF